MLKTQVIPPAAMPAYLQPGEILADRYRLERELGRGSMGTVWSAVHLTLGQRVAIKLISAEHVESPDARLRFSNEAKAAARLKSRHVVQVYDDGQTSEGMPYIVMEYLDGETLEERIERLGDLPLADAVRVTTHVGRALARAHAQGIIHRDLKPPNIFLAKSEDDELGWVAKVLDFGVAKLTGSADPSTTKTGTLVGTPLFMAPEQVRGASHVDHRADLYSLGMVFYNMVTGRFAFDAPSYSDVLIGICMSPLPDLKEAAPWVPESVRAWYAKACARDAGERFQSADEMVDALQEQAGRVQRPERSSAPDEASGPFGTVVGYMGPDLAPGALVISSDPAQITARIGSPSPTQDAPPIVATNVSPVYAQPSAPRHAAQPAAPPSSAAVVAEPARPVWPLFLAAGAGLGLAFAGGAVLFLLARPAPPARPLATPSIATTIARAPAAVPSVPPMATALTAPAPPPSSTVSEAPRTTTRPKAVRASTAVRPATTGRPASATMKTAPKGAPPDIGF